MTDGTYYESFCKGRSSNMSMEGLRKLARNKKPSIAKTESKHIKLYLFDKANIRVTATPQSDIYFK